MSARSGSAVAAALSNRDFRNFWLAGTVGDIAVNMWFLASAWVLLELTDSPIWVGLLGITAVPAIALSLIGGSVADRVSRVNILIAGAMSYTGILLITAVLAQLDALSRWHILGLSSLIGVAWAFQEPARKAIVAQLVEKGRLITANALTELSEFSGEVSAPLVVGFLIAASGASAVYWVAFSLIVIEIIFVTRISQQAASDKSERSHMWREIRDGIAYMRGTEPFGALTAIALTGLFASMLLPLVPVVARDVLNSGATGFGIISAAFGAGLAAGSVALVFYGGAGRKAQLMLVSHLVASVAIALFGLSHSLALSAALVFIVGLGTAVGGNMVVTLFHISADDRMRGRVMGVYSVTSAMIPLGSVLGGWAGSVLGIKTALIISASASFAPVLVAYLRSPALRRL